jgi:hypothetical protein
LSATATAGKKHVFATILKISGRVISFYNGGPIWLAGIFQVKQLRAPGFISVGHRQKPTTRNIPELGISTDNLRLGISKDDQNIG